MDYFHTDSQRDLDFLASVFTLAATHGRTVRLSTDGNALKIKVGEGMWSAPLRGTPDPYRGIRNDTPRPVKIPGK